ncbi:hypothetical protein C8Q80DRAFT_150295 [Daedaleopsis nitida]|nr:hypothetical protein C8Q80DRAFT_150295 [Daedaleopsis nitida]
MPRPALTTLLARRPRPQFIHSSYPAMSSSRCSRVQTFIGCALMCICVVICRRGVAICVCSMLRYVVTLYATYVPAALAVCTWTAVDGPDHCNNEY